MGRTRSFVWRQTTVDPTFNSRELGWSLPFGSDQIAAKCRPPSIHTGCDYSSDELGHIKIAKAQVGRKNAQVHIGQSKTLWGSDVKPSGIPIKD
jgi:hypothetical protein